MSSIPEKFKIDFDAYRRDMPLKAVTRMLSQDKASNVFHQFLEALLTTGPQWAYDEILKQQEANTLYKAEGFNLDIIGRIVGQPRAAFKYDESRWLFADRSGQGADQGFTWVDGATMSGNRPAPDPEYRRRILARIICNFNRFSSLPELAYMVKFATGETVSYRRVGPMECELFVRSTIPRTYLEMLSRFTTTTEADDVPMIPYAATLSLKRIVFMPKKTFFADRGCGHQADAGATAVSRIA